MNEIMYLVVLCSGKNVDKITVDDKTSANYIKFRDRKVMALYNSKENAIKSKERYQAQAAKGDKFFVESVIVSD